MKHCRSWSVLLCITIHAAASAQGNLELLPAARTIPPFTANPTEHRLSLAKVFEENRYIGSLGGVMPLVEVRSGGSTAQLSVAGTFYSHLSSADHQFIVTTGDFFVDALLDIQYTSAFAFRAGMGHTSQHLMDDALEVMSLPHSINYARDYLQFFAVHKNTSIGGFLYAGCFYNYSFIINSHLDGTMMYEFGGEAVNAPLAPTVRLYIAADIKLRGESAFGTSQNYQAGIKIARDDGGRSVRCAVNYQTGLEERGQFYNRRVTQTVLGFYFDL